MAGFCISMGLQRNLEFALYLRRRLAPYRRANSIFARKTQQLSPTRVLFLNYYGALRGGASATKQYTCFLCSHRNTRPYTNSTIFDCNFINAVL